MTMSKAKTIFLLAGWSINAALWTMWMIINHNNQAAWQALHQIVLVPVVFTSLLILPTIFLVGDWLGGEDKTEIRSFPSSFNGF